MAQILSLKAETATPSERTGARSTSVDNERQGFADAFERELKPSASQADPSENKTERSRSNNSEASESARRSEEKTARDDDGKKLPEENSKAEKAAASDNDKSAEQKKIVDRDADNKSRDASDAELETQQQALVAAFERIPAGETVKNASTANQNGESSKAVNDKTLSQQIAKLAAHLDNLKADQPQPALSQVLEKAKSNAESPVANIRADILAALKGRSSESEKTAGSEIKIDKLLAKASENGDINQKQLTEMLRQMQPQSNHNNASGDRAVTGLMNAASIAAASNSGAQQSSGLSNPNMQSLDIQADIKSPNWSRVVSSRVVWMAQQGMQQAELRLNPPTLGPVDVRLSVQNDQTTVSFLANNATTREALEQALPRLRESFQENGLQLAHADVGEQSSSDEDNTGEGELARDGEATNVQVALPDDDNPDAVNNNSTDNADGLSLYA